MVKFIIFLLLFGSIGFLAHELIPYLMRRYSQSQQKRMNKISKELDKMFMFAEKKKHLRPLFMITPLGLGIVGFILMHNPIGVIAGVGVGLIIPKIIVKLMAQRRVSQFQAQLVDALMLMSSCLKAGMSLNQSFEVLVEELPPPISDEFSLVIRANQMGVSMDECLAHLKKRMPVEDLDLITTAISISRDTGGDLTEIFSQLVFTMREKRKLEDRVKALTVQGRLQGLIMGILPIGFGIFIYFVNPKNFQILLTDKIGQMLLIWAVISEVIGVILIKRLSRVEV